MCLEIQERDPVYFLPAPRLAWQAALPTVKLDLLASMLLTVEKGITGGICHAIYRYAKTNNKYVKDYDRNKKYSHLNFLWMGNVTKVA